MLKQAGNTWSEQEAGHLLNRAGFGGSPDEIRRVHRKGRVKAVDWLLNGVDSYSEWENSSADKIAEVRQEIFALRRKRDSMTPEEAERKRRELNQRIQRSSREAGRDLTTWWFNRMVQTDSPLREKMVLFWHDHFVSSLQKVRNPGLIHRQNELFRTHARGNFKALTHDVLQDPAMLLYLDVATSKKDNPNENFAREVLELFTLGEGNYSEADIRESARAFTGYRVDRRRGEVTHVPAMSDRGVKSILGEEGKFDGAGVIEVIFRQEAASQLIPLKIWEFFVYEKPGEDVLRHLSSQFAESEFELGPVLREIFLSQEFYSERAMRTQIKSPIQFLVQLCRQMELDTLPTAYLASAQIQLGQILFQPPNVAGWDWGQAWINTNTLLSRYNIAGIVTKGSAEAEMELPGQGRGGMRMAGAMRALQRNWSGPDYEEIVPRDVRGNSEELVDALAFRLFQAPLGGSERVKFLEFADAQRGQVFTNTEVAELVHLMMSTPYYQLT